MPQPRKENPVPAFIDGTAAAQEKSHTGTAVAVAMPQRHKKLYLKKNNLIDTGQSSTDVEFDTTRDTGGVDDGCQSEWRIYHISVL